MAKIQLQAGASEEERHAAIGKAILEAWKKAHEGNAKVELRALAQELKKHLNLEDRSGGKKVEIDVVVDSDLDDDTRLVWLAIPTLEIPEGVDFDAWLTKVYLQPKGVSQDQYERQLGGSILFGCGH